MHAGPKTSKSRNSSDMQPLTIIQKNRDEVAVLHLKGTLVEKPDVHKFEAAVYDLLRQEKRKVVVDLRELKLVNSSGLGAMVSAMVSLRGRGGGLILTGLEGEVNRVVRSMHLDKVFDIDDTVERAEARFR